MQHVYFILLAVKSAIWQFRHFLEGRKFIIFANHKLLVYAIQNSSEMYSPRKVRYLEYIFQFSTDYQHASGFQNTAADALPRVQKHRHVFEYTETRCYKRSKNLLVSFLSASINIQSSSVVVAPCTVLCDLSKEHPRSIVPAGMSHEGFDTLHNLSHPGYCRTIKLASDWFVWPRMIGDVRKWIRCCLCCHRSNVHRCKISYIVTCVQRFTRWPEAILIPDTSSATVARNNIEHWAARYRCPSTITTDGG